MAASDGTIRSRHLGTDQANRRVIARDAVWPEHLAPETVRWLRRGLLADEPGAVRRYHDGDGVTRAAQGAWLSARVPAQTWDGPLQLDADDDEVLRRQWSDAGVLPVDGYYDVHVQVPVETPGEHTIEARVARGQTISETVWAAGTLAGVVPLGPAQAGDSWELRCDGLPIAEGTLTIQLVHRLDGGDSPRFWTDFSEYDVGDLPVDWTTLLAQQDRDDGWKVVEDEERVGGQYLSFPNDAEGEGEAVGWDRLGQVDDGEAVALVSVSVDTGNSFRCGPVARVRELQDGYQALVRPQDPSLLVDYIEHGGEVSTIASAGLDGEWDESGWHWIRLRVDGNRLRARAWREDDDEPQVWQIDTTDDRIPSGAWGVAGSFSLALTNERRVDVFGFAPVGRAPMSLE